jgi:hypothetical protein
MWHVAVHSLHQSIVNVAHLSSRSGKVLEPIGHTIHTIYYSHSPCPQQRYPSLRRLHNCTYTNSFIGHVSLSTTARLQKGGLRVHMAQYVLCTAGLSQLRRYRCGSEPLSRQTHSLTHTSYYDSYRRLDDNDSPYRKWYVLPGFAIWVSLLLGLHFHTFCLPRH